MSGPADTTEWEKEVGAAIATKLASVAGIIEAVSFDAENFSNRPAGIVLIPELELETRSGTHETWSAIYPIVIFPELLATVGDSTQALVGLIGRIRLAWWTDMRLNLAYVTESKLLTLKPDLWGFSEDVSKREPVLMGEVQVKVTNYGQRT